MNEPCTRPEFHGTQRAGVVQLPKLSPSRMPCQALREHGVKWATIPEEFGERPDLIFRVGGEFLIDRDLSPGIA